MCVTQPCDAARAAVCKKMSAMLEHHSSHMIGELSGNWPQLNLEGKKENNRTLTRNQECFFLAFIPRFYHTCLQSGFSQHTCSSTLSFL